MGHRERLLEISSQKDDDQYISFVKECKTEGAGCLAETLTSCSKKQIDQIWTGIIETFSTTLSSLTSDTEESLVSEKTLDVVQCLVAMVAASISQDQVYTPPPLIQSVVLLHGALPSLPDREDKVKNRIAVVLEEWWKKDLPRKENLIINAVVFLIERSLDLNPKPLVADVKRVWSLREVLPLVHLTDDSSAQFYNSLLRCFHAKQYVQLDEGRRFLAYVLRLDVVFIESAHSVIKNNLLTAPRSWRKYYGEIYFRAWQMAESPQTEKLELHCIQDLMYRAVHAQKTLFQALKGVLGYIHKKKQQRGVETMLCRLYEPFLWRSLKVANGCVRGNAADLFFSICPVQNSDFNTGEKDQLLQKQFDLFEVLLYDPVPEVRSLSVLGVFNIMTKYWEMIPTDTLRNLILGLIQDLLMDLSSADVRESVVKGLTRLLDNPLCHVFLKTILPEIHNSFHDTSEKVRVAMIDLLLKIKGLRTIKYWTVVPMEHLLARLAIDSHPVKRRIIKLIISSFIPLDASRDTVMSRCVELIQANRAAARQVFRYTPQHLGLAETVTYMSRLCRYILLTMNSGNEESESQSQDSEEDGRPEEARLEPEVVLGLCEAIVILWVGIRDQLKQASNAKLKKDLEKKFSYALPEMMKTFSDPEIQAVLIQIAGELPAGYIPTISRTFLPKLRNMENTATKDEFKDVLEALCMWGHAGDVMELVLGWLKPSLCPTQEEGPSRAGKKKKRVGFTDPQAPKPQLATEFLNFMFEHTPCRDILLKEHSSDCQQLSDILKESLERITERLSGQTLANDDFLLSAFSLYCIINTILSAEQEHWDSVFTEILTFATDSVSPWILQSEEQGREEETDEKAQNTRKFAFQVLKVFSDFSSVQNFIIHSSPNSILLQLLLGMFSDLLLVGRGCEKICSQIASFCTLCLAADEDLQLLPSVLLCLYQSIEFLNYRLTETESGSHGNDIPTAISKVFTSIAAYVKRHKTTDDEVFTSVKSILLEMIQAVIKATWINEEIMHEVMATVVATVMSELSFYSVQNELEEDENLPTLSAWLLNILMKKQNIFRLFLQEMSDCVESGVITDPHSVHGISHLMLHTLQKSTCKSELKELWTRVHTVIEKLNFDPNSSEPIMDVLKATKQKIGTCGTLLNVAS